MLQPPLHVWEKASAKRREEFEHLPGVALPAEEIEERLEAALEAVELDYLLTRWACRCFISLTSLFV